MERTNINREPRGPLLVLLLVIPIFALAGLQLYHAVAQAGDRQMAIRIARTDRSRVLRFQLDEETGVRGYGWTRDQLYLEPYRKAQAVMDDAFAQLRSALRPVKQSGELDRLVDRQQRTNAVWIATIAKPLILHPDRSPTMLELNRRGKAMIDDFRNGDQQLSKTLDDAALAADTQARAVVRSTLAFVLSALVVISLASGTFGFLQARAARRAFEAQLRFEDEKRIADSLQQAFLNTTLPISPAVDLHAIYVPANLEAQVGGDWYDAFELPDGRILFSIGDVAGHGIEAAVVMSRARQAIIAAALHENDPAKVLERANASIYLQHSRMVTAICGYIDPQSLEITYATAGHPPPILARPNEPSRYLQHDGIPLGILPEASYRTFVTHAFNGAVLVLYTDGVIEHTRNIIEGEQQLLEAASFAVSEKDPRRQLSGASLNQARQATTSPFSRSRSRRSKVDPALRPWAPCNSLRWSSKGSTISAQCRSSQGPLRAIALLRLWTVRSDCYCSLTRLTNHALSRVARR
jgi:CHASE3 domain sensor protein